MEWTRNFAVLSRGRTHLVGHPSAHQPGAHRRASAASCGKPLSIPTPRRVPKSSSAKKGASNTLEDDDKRHRPFLALTASWCLDPQAAAMYSRRADCSVSSRSRRYLTASPLETKAASADSTSSSERCRRGRTGHRDGARAGAQPACPPPAWCRAVRRP